MLSLVEEMKVVNGLTPVTTNGGADSDYISMKYANKLFAVVKLTQAAAHATLLTPTQASAVAGTGAKALTNNIKVWANEDVAASDTMVEQTDAKNYTVTADVKNKIVVFEINANALDVNNGFDCIKIAVADSSEATNFVDVTFYADLKYKGATTNTMITD